MFQLEKEDLIPRCAPKPAESDVSKFHPSVPEISIVFTQKESGQLTCSPPTVVTSYSVWKNKCLPSVPFPPGAESYTELSSTSKRSNVYPLRTEKVVVPSMNYTVGQIALNKSEFATTAGKNTESTLLTAYSKGSQTPKFSPKCILKSSNSINSENSFQLKPQPFPSTNLDKNILKISTGTQTDNFFYNPYESHISNLATKGDVAEIKSMIVEMEMEHRHLLATLQNAFEKKLELSSDKSKPNLCDIRTENDEHLTEGNLIQTPSHISYELIEENITKEEDYDYLHKSNTKAFKKQAKCTAVTPQISNTTTEQSIVMNELAVKYLPNGKLNDMLPDTLIETKVQNQYESPLKNIGKLDKNATDLSTASYKYLKKYRLLPEENNNFPPTNNVPKLLSEDKQENLLDLEMIRCKPKFM